MRVYHGADDIKKPILNNFLAILSIFSIIGIIKEQNIKFQAIFHR